MSRHKKAAHTTTTMNAETDTAASNRRWREAKTQLLKDLSQLPKEYPREKIQRDYEALLEALQREDVKCLKPKIREFQLKDEFKQLALSYPTPYGMACFDRPLSVEHMMLMVDVGVSQREGKLSVEKARGIIMDAAEGLKRLRTGHPAA